MMPNLSWRLLSKEAMASVVVFLVALPLCMGVAIASGVPPALGLVTGIVGGLLVGFIAGAPLQVSGPAAGLVVLVYELVQTFGIVGLGIATLLAGVIQFGAGLLKLGRWFRAVSPAVIQGMLAGIGVLIFASQFHVMFDDAPRANGLVNLLSVPEAIYKGTIAAEDANHQLAGLTGISTILGIVLWTRFKPRVLKAVPGPLVGVVIASAVANLFAFPIRFVNAPANIAAELTFFNLDQAIALLANGSFIVAVIGLALVASAETLLCATALDRMGHKGGKTDHDRELAAQGFGNMICGAIGALPMTGVIVRSSANVEAGASTRFSTIMHGTWLLTVVVFFPVVLGLIPTSSLAAVLVYTGYRLAHPSRFKEIAKIDRGHLLVMVGTVVSIVSFDLLTGVLVGLGLALIKLLITFSRIVIDVEPNGAGRVEIGLHGAATFLNLPKLAEALEALPKDTEVHVHVGGLAHIDHACIELLEDMDKQLTSTGGKLVVEWDDLQVRSKRLVTSSFRPQTSTL